MRVRSSLLCAAALLTGSASSLAIRAQGVPTETTAAAVAERPPPAFSSVEAKRFLGVLGLGVLAYTLDDPVREYFVDPADPSGQAGRVMAEWGNFYGSPGVLGLGIALWGGGLVARKPTVAASGLRAIEAIVVSSLVTGGLKESMGRARPYVAVRGREDWKLMRGATTSGGEYQSFASGHTTAAFAFATAVTSEVALHAPQHARAVGVATFSMAGLTAYARMHDDRHWLSDVTVGAGIGTVTALAITRWHATRPENGIDRWLLRPVIAPSPFGGTRLGFELRVR